MDWSKTKIYLIIALLMVNLILLNSLYTEQKNQQSKNYYTKEGLHDLNTHLYRYGIKLNLELKQELIPTKTLLVEYKSITQTNYPELFRDFGNSLDILGDKHMMLRLPSIKITQGQDEAMTFTIEFLEKYFPSENFDIKNIQESEDKVTITLNPLIEGKILEDAKTVFTFDKFLGLEIEKTQMQIIEEQEKPNRQKNSVEAIVEAAPHLNYGVSIEKVDLIYYYSSSVNQTIFNTKTATAMPTWRIKTSDGNFQYVLAID